jgi:hypothetical protein
MFLSFKFLIVLAKFGVIIRILNGFHICSPNSNRMKSYRKSTTISKIITLLIGAGIATGYGLDDRVIGSRVPVC